MKATAIRFLVEGFLFVAATLAIAPAPSMAMGDKVGEFKSPLTLHWGEVVLPPGSYSISNSGSGATPMMCIYKTGSPSAGYFIPAATLEMVPASSGQAQLVLGTRDGTVYVRELKLGGEGMDLYYAPPKAKK
jgi:hypothetical protein